MNPIIIYRVIAGIGTLVGVAGGVYGYDQHNKRNEESEIFDEEINDLTQKSIRLKKESDEKDEMLRRSNKKVRDLAKEVEKLKKDLTELEQKVDTK